MTSDEISEKCAKENFAHVFICLAVARCPLLLLCLFYRCDIRIPFLTRERKRNKRNNNYVFYFYVRTGKWNKIRFYCLFYLIVVVVVNTPNAKWKWLLSFFVFICRPYGWLSKLPIIRRKTSQLYHHHHHNQHHKLSCGKK